MPEVKTGTIETLPEDETESPGRKTRLDRGNGNGPNGGGSRKRGGGGGDDDGGDGSSGGGGENGPKKHVPPDPDAEERAEDSIRKYRISMWALIAVAFMTFVGLTAAYMMLAANPQLEWRPFDLPFQLWISTAIILISSLTFDFGKNNIYSGHQQAALRWLMATTVLGAIFIASQLTAWLEMVNRGVYMSGNPYAGFFYILTIAHALHVLGGMGALGYVVVRIMEPTESKEELKRRHTAATISGWFWHFLAGLWVVLFLLLGFWK